jgi:hypothetical protein
VGYDEALSPECRTAQLKRLQASAPEPFTLIKREMAAVADRLGGMQKKPRLPQSQKSIRRTAPPPLALLMLL